MHRLFGYSEKPIATVPIFFSYVQRPSLLFTLDGFFFETGYHAITTQPFHPTGLYIDEMVTTKFPLTLDLTSALMLIAC